MPDAHHARADATGAATWVALRRASAPPAFTDAVADLLVTVFDLRRPVVDLGAGSGHLAQALAARGATVTALDLSVPMLALVPSHLRRVAADVVALPLRDGAAGAALAAHVLHVVPAWRQAVAELDRVVGAEGVVLVQAGASSGARGHLPELRQVFGDHLPPQALVGSPVAGPGGADVVAEAFASLGRQLVELPEVSEPREETARGLVRWMEGNPWSWPGPSTDAERAAAAAATEAWAIDAGIDLDAPFATTAVNRWRAYARPFRPDNPQGPSGDPR